MSTSTAADTLDAACEAVVRAYLDTDQDLADIADRYARSDSDAFGVMARVARTIDVLCVDTAPWAGARNCAFTRTALWSEI